MKNLKAWGFWMVPGILLLAILMAWAGARINTTPSIAIGLYWASAKPVIRGSYVQLCPPLTPMMQRARAQGVIAAGFCPGGYGFLMKRVVALGPDEVTWSPQGLMVNGIVLPGSAPLPGSEQMWIRHDSGPLGQDQVLVMGDRHPASFDSRYFGPIPLNQIRSVIVPVLTAESFHRLVGDAP